MAEDLQPFIERATELIRRDEKRDQFFESVDRIFHMDWSLPEPLKSQQMPWLTESVSPSAHVSIMGGVRIMSSVRPRVTVQPADDGIESKAKAGEWERALLNCLDDVSRRRNFPIVSELMLSALLYMETCAQVVHLPTQIESVKALGGDTNRYEAMLRRGPFAVTVRNPRTVHAEYSDLMPEAVLHVVKKKPKEITDFWGKRADFLKGSKLKEVTLYDYVDLAERMVLVDTSGSPHPGREGQVILHADWEYPYLPWACRIGGTGLWSEPDKQRLAMLYAAYRGNIWNNENIARTLLFSEAITFFGQPRNVFESATRDHPVIDYTNPTMELRLMPGEKWNANLSRGLDPGMQQTLGMFGKDMQTTTLSEILTNPGELPSGVAFATVNLASQSARAVLEPAKEMVQWALADIFELKLNCIHYSGKDYSTRERSRGQGTAYGKQYVIKPGDIDPTNIHIEVELTPDLPTDRLQRMNTAILGVRERILSRERARDEVGIMDSAREQELIWSEQLLDHELQMELEKEKQQMTQELAMQQAAEQAALQAQMGQAEQQPAPGAPPGIPGVGGEGFDPAMGGIPPQMADPFATFEGMTGTARNGQEIVPGGVPI